MKFHEQQARAMATADFDDGIDTLMTLIEIHLLQNHFEEASATQEMLDNFIAKCKEYVQKEAELNAKNRKEMKEKNRKGKEKDEMERKVREIADKAWMVTVNGGLGQPGWARERRHRLMEERRRELENRFGAHASSLI
jgi:hypothetical protein